MNRQNEHSTGMTEEEVFECLEFWRSQHVVWVLNLSVWPIWAVFLWGLGDPRDALAWSTGALAYSIWVFLKGWTPWRMPVYQMYRHNAFDPEDYSPIQKAVQGSLSSRRNRSIGAAVTATAVLTPWLFLVATKAFDLKHIGHGAAGVPVWLFLILGLVDAIRAATFAMQFWLKDTFARWPEILKGDRVGVA